MSNSILEHAVMDRYNVCISGNGTQVILFAHGFGCDQTMWRLVAPAFENDYKVILFDYIGHGKTSMDSYNRERYSTLHGYTQDILDICDALDLHEVNFVGHSVSSMIGMLACIREPDRFKKLVMLGPSARYINDVDYYGGFERSDVDDLISTMDSSFFGWANSFAPTVMGKGHQPSLSNELASAFCRTDVDVALQFARVTFYSDNRRNLPQLKTPTLVIQSIDDVIAPVEVGKYIASQVPNSTLEITTATGHCPHLSAPEETIKLIATYLRETN